MKFKGFVLFYRTQTGKSLKMVRYVAFFTGSLNLLDMLCVINFPCINLTGCQAFCLMCRKYLFGVSEVISFNMYEVFICLICHIADKSGEILPEKSQIKFLPNLLLSINFIILLSFMNWRGSWEYIFIPYDHKTKGEINVVCTL